MSATSGEGERPSSSHDEASRTGLGHTGTSPGMPMRSWTGRLAPVFRQLAALGVLALAVRTSYALGMGAFDHFEAAPNERGSTRRGSSASPGGAPEASSAPEQSGDVGSFDGARRPKKPNPVRPRRLVVDVGTDRSEVYIYGRRVGQVPYVGEWACSGGDLLELTIVPPLGAPTDYRVPCRGEDINVRSDQQVGAAD